MTQRPWLVGLTLAAGVLAAVLVPGHRPGAGLTAAALAVVAAAFARGAGGRVPAALALALCLAASVRDAGWVVAIALVAAAALAAVAATGARTWGEVFAALPAPVRAAPAAALVFARVAVAPLAGRPLGDPRPAARGLAVAGVLTLTFGALFASADAAFAQLAGDLLTPEWDLGMLPARAVCFGAFALASAALATVALRPAPAFAGRATVLGRTEWTIALLVVDALFAAFVAVQLTAMFGGADHVLQTAGLTYAEYAREGFAQLLVVAGLTLAVTAAAGRTAPRAPLGVLLALTLVVVASALHRLGLYQEAFGFTRLRLTADAIGLWLGALVVLVLILGATETGRRRLPRVAVATTGLAVLILVVANPDGYVAARNVDRYERTGRLDRSYASSLSADATPALAALPPGLAACVLGDVRARLAAEDDGIGGANVARARARSTLRDVGAPCSP